MYGFTYQKRITSYTSAAVFKIVESFESILNSEALQNGK